MKEANCVYECWIYILEGRGKDILGSELSVHPLDMLRRNNETQTGLIHQRKCMKNTAQALTEVQKHGHPKATKGEKSKIVNIPMP